VTLLYAAAIAAEWAAALAGIVLSRRRREHVPAAVALSLLAVAACVQVVTNTRHALVHADRVVTLGAAAIIPGLAVAVFLSPRLRLPAVACVVAAWVVGSVLVNVLLPPPAYVAIQKVYLGADLAGLAVSIAALVTWGWWAKGRASPGSAHAVAIGLVSLDLGILLTPYSPWRGSIFGGRFDVVQILILGFFIIVTIVEVILWRFSAR
jgi:hypothetical protein